MGDLARRGETAPARTEKRDRNPLNLLPSKEWRQLVKFFFQAHSDLLKSPVGIVARLRLWVKEDGLTVDEATAAMRATLQPAACARYQYAGQLLAELSGSVAELVRKRKAAEREAKFKADQARQRAEAFTGGIGFGGRTTEKPPEAPCTTT